MGFPPVLKSGFGGLSLKISSYTGGFILLVFESLTVIFLLTNPSDAMNQIAANSGLSKTMAFFSYVVAVFMRIGLLLLNLLMLNGIYHKNPKYIWPFIIAIIALIVLTLLGAIQSLVHGLITFNLLIAICYALMAIYFDVVFYSFCEEIRHEQNSQSSQGNNALHV